MGGLVGEAPAVVLVPSVLANPAANEVAAFRGVAAGVCMAVWDQYCRESVLRVLALLPGCSEVHL